jgi:hypothetical protein
MGKSKKKVKMYLKYCLFTKCKLRVVMSVKEAALAGKKRRR